MANTSGGGFIQRGVVGVMPTGRNAPAPMPVGPADPRTLITNGLPGTDFPPDGATPVDEPGDGSFSFGVASPTLVTITVPDGQKFRMSALGFDAEDPAAFRWLSWAIRAGSDAIPGYSNRRGRWGSITEPAPIRITRGSQDVITIVASCIAPGPLAGAQFLFHVSCRVQGWFYAESL